MWDQLVEGVKEFFNQPVTIIISSLTSATVGVLTIISKTSFGKRAIHWLKEKMAYTIKIVDDIKAKSEETYDFAVSKTDELKNHYEAKLNEIYNQLDVFEKGVVACIEKIPNVQVQEQLKVLVQSYEQAKGDIVEFSKLTYADAQAQIEQIKNDYGAQISILVDKINQIEELVAPLRNIEESGENEQKQEE